MLGEEIDGPVGKHLRPPRPQSKMPFSVWMGPYVQLTAAMSNPGLTLI